MFYFTSLFYILSITALLVLLTGKRFERVVSLSFIVSDFVLFFTGFITDLKYGFYIITLLAILFYICLFIKKDRIKDFVSNYFTVGFYVYLLILLFLFVLYRFKGFENCDEFMHWGPMVKAMFNTGHFYSEPNMYLSIHRDYPPFFALIELLFCYFGSAYKERYLYIGIISFMISLFLPLFENLNTDIKGFLKSFVITLIVVVTGLTIGKTVTASDSAFVYNSIYVDWSLSVFCAYLFFMIIKENDWNNFFVLFLSICFSALLIMKQMSIVLYLMILFFAFIKVLFIDKKMDMKLFIKGIVFLAVIPLMIMFIWSLYIKALNINGQFNAGEISIGRFISIIRWTEPEAYRSEAYNYFVYELIHREIFNGLIKCTYLIASLIIPVLLFIASNSKKTGICLSATYLIGSAGYALVMLVLYTLLFSSEEAIGLASFDRYMCSFVYIGICLISMISLDNIKGKIGLGSITGILFIVSLVNVDSAKYIVPRLEINENYQQIHTVLVVQRYDDGISFTREDTNGKIIDITVHPIDKLEELKETMKEYDYLYIECYDDEFYHYWLENINDDVPYVDTLYLIEYDNENYSFRNDTGENIYHCLKYYTLNSYN